jgi:hypothetical protein
MQPARKGGREVREGVGELRRGEQAQHVGTDGVERDVAEIEQTGVTDDDVQAEREQHVEQRDVDDANPGVAGHLHEERQHQERDGGADDDGQLLLARGVAEPHAGRPPPGRPKAGDAPSGGGERSDAPSSIVMPCLRRARRAGPAAAG